MVSGITVKNKKLSFGKVSIDTLIKKYGTPLYVFSEQRLIDNYSALIKAFRKHYKNTFIYYSIKTNYELQILKTLKNLDSKGEAASGLEVELATRAGFKPYDLIVDGPAWTDEDIKLFIKLGLRTLNVDSMDAMIRVDKIAKKLNKKVRVTFRIFPEIKIPLLKSFIENYIAKFGIRASDAVDEFKAVKSLKNVIPVGISAHIGSMITDPAFYEKAIDKYFELASRLNKELNINIEEINIGGGFGLQSLNYFTMHNIILEKAGITSYEKAASIEEFGERIANRFKENSKKYGLPQIDLILEPGRFLVSDTGILLTKVVAVKKDWIFIDGGINLIPESIFFIRRGFIVDEKVGVKADHKYNIAGPTLNTADVLATNQKLPKIEVGDTVVVLDAGAYSLTRSNQFTILRPNALYITKNKKVKLLRKAESPEEIYKKMIV